MSRDIKFRFWTGQRIVAGGPDYLLDSSDGEVFETMNGHCEAVKVSRSWIPLQFTGLKDSEGKEIYEGDIVQYRNTRLVVNFDRGAFLIGEYPDDLPLDHATNENVHKPQVIGNIYEHPELLGK